MITIAIKKTAERKAWEMWLTLYPNMNKDNFVPFSKFYESQTPKQISTKPAAEILKEAEETKRLIEGR